MDLTENEIAVLRRFEDVYGDSMAAGNRLTRDVLAVEGLDSEEVNEALRSLMKKGVLLLESPE